MKVICFEIEQQPQQGLPQVSGISSYPDILYDGPLDWLVIQPQHIRHLAQVIEQQRPAIVVLRGESLHSQAWKRLLGDFFPKLFMFEAAPHDSAEKIIDTLNERCWQLRRQRVKPGGVFQPVQTVDKSALFATLTATQRRQARQQQQHLEHTFKLNDFYPYMDTATYERTLYCLDLLAQCFDDISWPGLSPLQVLDVGTRQWSYAGALARYFRQKGSLALMGIDIDPWFYDRNNLSHLTQAEFYAKLAKATFREANFLDLHETWQVICHFLPLIWPPNALRWRLPLARHHPESLLLHTWACLKPQGTALLYNGTLFEYQQMIGLLQQLQIPIALTRSHQCRLRQRDAGYITLLQKPA